MSNYSEQIIATQDQLIKEYQEHVETLRKVIILQDEIIQNFDRMMNTNPEYKEKINHLKLVINNSKAPN